MTLEQMNSQIAGIIGIIIMKILLLFLLPIQLHGQFATIKLVDGTFIHNIPSGRDSVWYAKYNLTARGMLGWDTYHYPLTIIDDSRVDIITYYGSWRISTNGVVGPDNSPGNCNCSWSQGPWDSLVFKFTNATEFKWWGESMSHHGKVNAYFNPVREKSKFQATIDTYSPFNLSPTLNWSIAGLDTAEVYKFKLIPTNGQNIASSGKYVVIQYLELSKNFSVTPPDTIPPPIIPPGDTIPVTPPDTIVIDTIRILGLEYQIIRDGRFQIFIDGVQDEGEHNEYEKAIEHALRVKALNQTKNVTIKSPIRKIELE